MDTLKLHSTRPTRRTSPISRRWHAVVAATRRALAAWHQARRCARDTAALRQLDAASLRDLGVHPSEFASYWAEAEGQAELSRRRVVPRTERGSAS